MNKNLGICVLAFVLGTASMAQAAGFQLTEYSTTGLGRSFAGAGLVGDDFSAVAYNPAGMIFNTTSGAQIGASTVGIRSHVKGSVTGYGNHPAETGKTSPYIVRVLPAGFAQYQLNDRAYAGIGFYTPFGLATDYKNSWFGRTHALRSEIQAFNVSPAFSYKITDMISLGAALNIQYVDATMTSVVEKNLGAPMYMGGKADLQGNDARVGYTLGLTVEPIKGTRLGASYRSEVDHKLHGKNKVAGMTHPLNGQTIPYTSDKIYAKITTPEVVTLSASQQVGSAWTVSATARWTRWSKFKELNIYKESNGELVSGTVENWQNTWFYSVGADYKFKDNLIFRFGAAYDDTAVKSPCYRTARIPDGRRTWASVGLSYLKNNWQFDGGYAHLFVHTATAKHGAAGASNLDAKYSSNANIFSLSAQYKF